MRTRHSSQKIQQPRMGGEAWTTTESADSAPKRVVPSVPPESVAVLRSKRVFDVAAALAIVVMLGPVLLTLWVLIRLDSRGPAIYRQWRVGHRGQPFKIYKFRTMHLEAHADRNHLFDRSKADSLLFKLEADPRSTRLGRPLRLWSLDELPQLFNVLRGDMSIVGPRPFSIELFERPSWQDPLCKEWVEGRQLVVPGMTGPWQVAGRNDLPDEELMRLDLEYVEGHSLLGDVRILLETIPAVVTGRGAY